jgi:hypothetical protein
VTPQTVLMLAAFSASCRPTGASSTISSSLHSVRFIVIKYFVYSYGNFHSACCIFILVIKLFEVCNVLDCFNGQTGSTFGEVQNAYNFFFGISEGRKPIWIPFRW